MLQEEIVRLLQEDPARGLQKAIEQYASLVQKILIAKIGFAHREDAQELTSDVFYTLFCIRAQIDLQKGSLAAFLGTIAQRRAIDFLRKEKPAERQWAPFDDSTERCVFGDGDPVVQTEEAQKRKRVLDAVVSLGEPDAQIVFRRFYLNESFREIGLALSLSENAAQKRLKRSLKKLKDQLSKEDDEPWNNN